MPTARPDLTRPVVFSLDLEDHLRSYGAQARFAGNAIAILDLLESLEVRGTFFIVARIAETHPALVRQVAARGHEIACHSYDHTPIDRETRDGFAANLAKAKQLLEQVSGQGVSGFRAPIFSLTRATAWATGIIRETGFDYSSSVVPAPNPLYGFDGAPRVPFRWPSGLLEFPCPVASFLGASLPFLGGVYFRYLPWPMIRGAILRMPPEVLPWTYLHPYDFDTSEPFGRMPETSWLTNVICWMNRRGTAPRLRRLFADRPSARFRDLLDSGAIKFAEWAPG
jgi:peptidoglycan-N-acetylglucosamine deacetylase